MGLLDPIACQAVRALDLCATIDGCTEERERKLDGPFHPAASADLDELAELREAVFDNLLRASEMNRA